MGRSPGQEPLGTENICTDRVGESLLERTHLVGTAISRTQGCSLTRQELEKEVMLGPHGNCRTMEDFLKTEVPAELGKGLWAPLGRHVGRRAWYKEGMSSWIWESGTSGCMFLQIRPFASVSPGEMASSCVQRAVSVIVNGIQCHAGDVSPQQQGRVPASLAWPAPFPCIHACHSVSRSCMGCACCCIAMDFCPIVANQNVSSAEVSLLILWLQKGQLIPDPLQPVFTNLPSK